MASAVLIAWVTAGCLLCSGDVAPRVAVKIEGGGIRYAPADLRLRVTVEPNDANRRLTVEADSGSFYRRSDEDLTGESPRTRWVDRWRAFPAGDYAIRATVIDAAGTAHSAKDTLTIRDWDTGP